MAGCYSTPASLVNSMCFSMSAGVTVGRTAVMARTKSAMTSGGSRRSSDSMSVHVFSCAAASPGEHGVQYSLVSPLCAAAAACSGEASLGGLTAR